MSLTNSNFAQQQPKTNTIQIEITDPQNHINGNKKYTDYLVRTKVSLNFYYNFISHNLKLIYNQDNIANIYCQRIQCQTKV